MNNYGMVCFAIKMGAYDKAVEHLKAIEAQNLEMDVQTLANLNDYEKEQYIERHNARLKKIRKEIELISIPDMNYINAFIAKNEEYSLNNLCRSRQTKGNKKKA